MCHIQMKIYYAFKRNIKRNTDVPKFKSIYITQYGLKKKKQGMKQVSTQYIFM